MADNQKFSMDSLIQSFFEIEIGNQYGTGKYHFFCEDNIVWEFHKYLLKSKIGLHGRKIYNEFPLKRIFPYEISDTKLDAQETKEILTDKYTRINSTNIFEAKYTDISILSEKAQIEKIRLASKENPVDYSFEFKYEPLKKRRDHDMKHPQSNGFKCDAYSIMRDIAELEMLFYSGAINEAGYFILIDEHGNWEDKINIFLKNGEYNDYPNPIKLNHNKIVVSPINKIKKPHFSINGVKYPINILVIKISKS